MNDNLTYSNAGLKLTESFEGVRLAAYRDQAGILTIGYGHTGHDVTPGMTITQEQAEQLLAHDVQSAESAVKRFVKIVIEHQEIFDALVDFTFNVGAGNFLKSTLLKYVNIDDLHAAQMEFQKWDKVAGQVNAGLARRRLAEAEMFQHGIVTA